MNHPFLPTPARYAMPYAFHGPRRPFFARASPSGGLQLEYGAPISTDQCAKCGMAGRHPLQQRKLSYIPEWVAVVALIAPVVALILFLVLSKSRTFGIALCRSCARWQTFGRVLPAICVPVTTLLGAVAWFGAGLLAALVEPSSFHAWAWCAFLSAVAGTLLVVLVTRAYVLRLEAIQTAQLGFTTTELYSVANIHPMVVASTQLLAANTPYPYA